MRIRTIRITDITASKILIDFISLVEPNIEIHG
jgi:hypothetical protein